MSQTERRHERLAARLSLIISRLLAGETLIMQRLAAEFDVSVRTLRRDFRERLAYLDLEFRNGQCRLLSGSRLRELAVQTFARQSGVEVLFPDIDNQLVTLLLSASESPCLIWHSATSEAQTRPDVFTRLVRAITEHRRVTLLAEGHRCTGLAPYQADVIGNYPWTKQFLLRERGRGAYYLADKRTHTVRKLKLSPASGFNSDLTSVYQGEDQGKGCYLTVIDTQYQLLDQAESEAFKADDYQKYMAQIKTQFSPKVILAIPESCVNEKQKAAIAAKHSEEEKKLQQWVARQSLSELCRRTGNC